MTSFSQILFNNDPSCCYRKAKRSSLEINLLENALYALYALVLTWICYIFNNMKGVYISFTLLSIVVGNIYSIKNIIAEKEHDLDISTDSDSSLVSETDESQAEELEEGKDEEIEYEGGEDEGGEDENESSILEDFKKVVNDTSIYEELESETVELSPQDLAIEYDRVANEYMNIERIIQNVAAEYREKASAAREAAELAREAELTADAADEREYNED